MANQVPGLTRKERNKKWKRDGPEKVQKQGEHEKMQEEYPTTEQRGKRKTRRLSYTIFPLVSVLFGDFLNQHPNRKRTRILCWRQMHFMLETNVIELHPHTYTASYQRFPNRLYIEIIATHLQKRAVAIMLLIPYTHK